MQLAIPLELNPNPNYVIIQSSRFKTAKSSDAHSDIKGGAKTVITANSPD